jgi:hypothetical protein
MRRWVSAALALVGVVAALVPASASASASSGRHPLLIAAQDLPRLSGAQYDGWVVKGDRKLSAGVFNVRERPHGQVVLLRSPIDPARADMIVVTIEPVPDPDPGPSAVAILAGEPRRHVAALRFPIDLRTVAGSFILATPTDDNPANETAGVWFLDPAGGPGASLTLPQPPAGWVFEGWGVTQSTPLTTGRFTSVTGPDLASPFSGPNPGPPFPGEDFLTGLPAGVVAPVNLADGGSMVVITIEPDIGGQDPTGAGPFSIKPLAGAVPAAASPGTSLPLTRDLSTVPEAIALF